MPHKVFLSFATDDASQADSIRQTLEDAGVQCWFAPRDILASRRYGEALLDAIESCRLLLLVFTPHVNDSNMVDREVGLAAGMGIPILPVRAAAGEPSRSLRFFIGTHNWFEASDGPLSESLPALVRVVQRLLVEAGPDRIQSAGTPARHLVVFSTASQATELWVTERGLELYLFDFKAGEAQRQWLMPPDTLRGVLEADDIGVKDTSRYKNCGVFAVGTHKRWLYSKKLFPDTARLRAALRALVKAGAGL
jgi:hypothetical protein